jgi:hypothetical protein
MAMGRDAIKRRIERIEQRQKAQVAEMIARIHQNTGLSIEAIIEEASVIAAYYREHGEWPTAVSEALRSPPTTKIVLRWDHVEPEEPDETDPERHERPPAPEPEADEDEAAELAELLAELRQRLKDRA